MNAQKLIELLQELPPETEVFVEVDGDVHRTGDYLPAEFVAKKTLRATTYGGFDEDTGADEFHKGEAVEAVLIH